MDKTLEQKREEILKRLESTRERKRKRLAEMEEYLRKAYKDEYGVEPNYVGPLYE
jgi:chaperonin cofactor prefoldin